MPINTSIEDLLPAMYLKAEDIPAGDLIVTILDNTIEVFGPDKKVVLYFRETPKLLVLNKANLKIVSDLYGTNPNNWVGKQLALYSTEYNFQGKVGLGVRVRLRPPQPTSGQNNLVQGY